MLGLLKNKKRDTKRGHKKKRRKHVLKKKAAPKKKVAPKKKAPAKKPAPAKKKPTVAPVAAPKPPLPPKPPTPAAVAPPKTVAPKPAPPPPRPPQALGADVIPNLPGGAVPVYTGTFGRREAERLLWRAGFGPRAGDVARVSAMSLTDAVRSLTRPAGDATLTGPAPRDEQGALDPVNVWGHEHLWWLDRMIRSDQPLVERMALIWHDWFANSRDAADMAPLMTQNALFRSAGLGSFKDRAFAVTQDGAMLTFLNGILNHVNGNNENYGRELMELFTLGADSGGYTEADVKEQARALTGWRADWADGTGYHNFRWDQKFWDSSDKTIFGQTGNWDWRAAVELCLRNPAHLTFFVRKLWSYFVPAAPDAATEAALAKLYRTSGWSIRAVVEAILMHPALYTGGPMVKPPVVFQAGVMRAAGQYVDRSAWAWRCEYAGQRLFRPPNVAGWDDGDWLDTSTVWGRWSLVYELLNGKQVSGS